jgi:hypothetical protein
MTKSEAEIWDRLLRTSIARDTSTQPTVFVEHVLENIKVAQRYNLVVFCIPTISSPFRFSESPQEFLTLLSYVDLTDRLTLPEAITSTVATVLGDLYPRQALVSTSLQIIRQLRDMILSAPSALALALLLALQDSICKWLEDDENVFDGDLRKEIVRNEVFFPFSRYSYSYSE